MGDHTHISSFTGGINTDDSNETIPAQDYRNAIDLEVGFVDNGSRNEAVLTRSPLEVTPIPSNNYVNIGGTLDGKGNLLMFDYAVDGQHQIRRVFSDGSSEVVVRTPALGFSNQQIISADVIENLLSFTQAGQPPKSLLLDKAQIWHESGGTNDQGYLSVIPDMFLAGALPPPTAPTFVYERVDSPVVFPVDFPPSFISQKTFQFAYYYVYDDRTESSPSPISELAWSQANVHPCGYARLEVEPRVIRLFFNTGMNSVRYIVFMAREGSTGAWYEFLTVDKYEERYDDFSIENKPFYGNEAGTPYVKDFVNYYDVPVTAKYQELLKEGNLVYANIETGHDKTPVNVEMDLVTNRIEPTNKATADVTNIEVQGTLGAQYYVTDHYSCIIEFNIGSLEPGDTAAIDLHWIPKYAFGYPGVTGRTYSYEDVGGEWKGVPPLPGYVFKLDFQIPQQEGTWTAISRYVSDEIIAKWREWSEVVGKYVWDDGESISPATPKVTSTSPEGKLTMEFPQMMVEVSAATRTVDSGNAPDPEGDMTFSDPVLYKESFDIGEVSNVVRTYKSRSTVRFALNYYDKYNRDNACMLSEAMIIEIPWSFDSFPYTNYLKRVVEAKIKHLPPMFATHYQWVSAEVSGISSFGYFVVSDSAENGSWFMYHMASVDQEFGHSITEGDEVYLADNPNYKPVIGIVKGIEGNKVFLDSAKKLSEGTLVEIRTYGYDAGENVIYQEFGQEYEIIDPHTPERRHQGQTQDQVPGDDIPALMTLESARTFGRWRYIHKAVEGDPDNPKFDIFWIESDRLNDYRVLRDSYHGRVAVHDPKAKRQRIDKVIHGGKYFQGTSINDLWAMLSGNDITLSSESGEITGLVQVGFTLVILQERHLSTLYIGRTVATNTDGTENVIGLDNRVLGTLNPSAFDYGTSHPESVSYSKRNVYFFDVLNKTWCRKAVNGIVPISDYKMKTYWSKVSDKLKGEMVTSSFDERRGHLVVNIPAFEGSPVPLTWIFSENENRWKGSFRFGVSRSYSLGADILGVFSGARSYFLWRNPSSPLTQAEIKVVLNSQSQLEKLMNTISYSSDGTWTVQSIEVPIEASGTGREMRTSIMFYSFEREESTYSAYVPGDLNTPGLDETIAKIEGDDMRGKVFIVTLVNRTGKRLSSVLSDFTYSMLTP